MSESLEDRLASIAAEAEAGEADQTDRPLPDGVSVSRPGRARSKVLQVRLNPDEFDALEAIAAARELPVSTVAREQLLKLVRAAAAPTDSSLTQTLEAMKQWLAAAPAELRRQLQVM